MVPGSSSVLARLRLPGVRHHSGFSINPIAGGDAGVSIVGVQGSVIDPPALTSKTPISTHARVRPSFLLIPSATFLSCLQ